MFDKRSSLLNNIRELASLISLFSLSAVTVLMVGQTWVNF